MNREQIIQMARDAGFVCDEADFIFAPSTERMGIQLELERFAAAIRAATKEEDAKICERLFEESGQDMEYGGCMSAADEIRASK